VAGVIEHFHDVMAGKAESILSGERGLRVVRTLEAAQKILEKKLG